MSDFMARPTNAERARRRFDLIDRCLLVQRNGWAEFRNAWSSGETAAVALLLQDSPLLASLGEDETSVIERWAFDLWGIIDGETDVAAGSPATREWFDEIRRGWQQAR